MSKNKSILPKEVAEKKTRKRPAYALKLKVIQEVLHGKITKNGAAKKYLIARSAIDYWINKYATLDQKTKHMSDKDEIKKLKARIKDLELIKDFQQDLIAEYEIETGDLKSKKYLPEQLASEIEKKRKKYQ